MANPWGARKYDYPKTEVTDWRVDGISIGGQIANPTDSERPPILVEIIAK